MRRSITSYGGDVHLADVPDDRGSKRMAANGRSRSFGRRMPVLLSATLHAYRSGPTARPLTRGAGGRASGWSCPLRTSRRTAGHGVRLRDARPGRRGLRRAACRRGGPRAPGPGTRAGDDSGVRHQQRGSHASRRRRATSASSASRHAPKTSSRRPRRPPARWQPARRPRRRKVLVVGGEGLEVALKEHDLVPVSSADDDPAAVVQGFHRSRRVGAARGGSVRDPVRRAMGRVQPRPDGPDRRGIAPGNGTLVRAVATAVGARAGRGRREALPTAVRRDRPPDLVDNARSWSAIGSTPTSKGR